MPRKKTEKKTPQEEKKLTDKGIFIPEEVESDPEEEETLQTIGQKIKEVRVSKNLSLESVSGHLHIALKILKALEEGTAENVSTPVFIRGLARAYCKFLGMEETGIADKLDRLLRTESSDENLNLKTLRPVQIIKEKHTYRNTMTVLVLVIGGYLFYTLYFSQMSFFALHDNETHAEPMVVEAETNIEPVQKIAPASQESVIFEKTITAMTEIQRNIQSEVVQNTLEKLVLEVEASDETWISIAVDGKETKDVRIRAEEIHQWEAKRQYLLTLGNTKVLRVLLNGREIETDRTNQLLTDWVIDANLIP